MPVPEISVVVPSHDRALRLRWMLNALERQTLPRDRWEVVVAHDSQGPETEELLTTHPLARAGVLRHVQLPPGSAPPGANRNAALGLARGRLIAFTDDDCRPPEDWLENVAAAAERFPGAIVQGPTIPDPLEENIARAPWKHSQFNPIVPVPWAQCCNILYPRDAIDAAGGFDETMYVGEDTDLRIRAERAGFPYVGDSRMLTYHAVADLGLSGKLRSLLRWEGLPELIRRHPEMREDFYLWIFWKRTHVWFPLAVAGAVLERRSPLYGVLAFPWLMHAYPSHGSHPRGRLRGLAELPGRALWDVTEIYALARGSIKHRTLFL